MDNIPLKNSDSPRWIKIATLTVFSVYFYVLMEWLFFVTKPSFMSCLGLRDSLLILAGAPLPFVIPPLVLYLVLFLLARLAGNPRLGAFLRAISRLIPVFIIAATLLILIDNFTYTVFKAGIQTSEGFIRPIYAAVFVGLLILTYIRLQKSESLPASTPAAGKRGPLAGVALAGLLIVLSVAGAVLTRGGPSDGQDVAISSAGTAKKKPNIILFCMDGANASHLSLYGYDRDTTPFLRQLAPLSLVCDNAFTNAGDSGSSDASILTGKMATTTRLIYPPDILRGKDSYQHLPGILRMLGYHNLDVSIRHYVDPYDLNLSNAFDEANQRRLERGYRRNFLRLPLSQDADYFVNLILERIDDRLLHAFMISKMENAYNEAVKTYLHHADGERIAEAKKFIADNPSPFFAHIHLIGTHGPRFNPTRKVYSAKQIETKDWMLDFYDDALAESDALLASLIDELKKNKLFDNTLLIVYTDHGQGYVTYNRLPLLFHFPGGEHAGHLKDNAQALDIAPTILDYLDVKQPEWMQGKSLLTGKPDPRRIILSVNRKEKLAVMDEETHLWESDSAKDKPPFFNLGFLNAVVGDKYYRLDLMRKKILFKQVDGRPPLENESVMPTAPQVEQYLIEHLKANHYDMTGFNPPLPIEKMIVLSTSATLAASLGDRKTSGTAVLKTPPPKPAILQWGPQFTKHGVDFQKQPSGASAMWFHVQNGSARLQVVFKGIKLSSTFAGDLITCQVPPELYAQPGPVEIYLVDSDFTNVKSNSVKFTVQ